MKQVTVFRVTAGTLKRMYFTETGARIPFYVIVHWMRPLWPLQLFSNYLGG